MLVPNSQGSGLSPNHAAFPLVQEVIRKKELLQVAVHKQAEVTVIDCGVLVPGSWKAGVLFAEICLGGLAEVTIHWADFDGFRWPAVEVFTDHPLQACLASQYAGWPLQDGELVAMGSGPGRAILHKGDVFKRIGCEDYSAIAILCIESEALPSEGVLQYLLRELRCQPQNLYILVAPTSSQVGSVQIAARALETGLSKLMELGYELKRIDSGWGICPLSPVAADPVKTLGRSNDGILYGSTVLYNLRDEDEVMASLVQRIPFCCSADYGRTFEEIYKENGGFYKIDPLVFSPAEVCLCNLNSGRSFRAGTLRPDRLRHSFEIVAQ